MALINLNFGLNNRKNKSHKFLPDALGSIEYGLVQFLLLERKFLHVIFLHPVAHLSEVDGRA